MSIIDTTYFIGPIALPTDNVNYTNKLQVYIDLSQRKELIRVLGYPLYKLFISELPTPTSDRFTDILDGAEFTDVNGDLDKWQGLVNSEKESMLAYFAYYEYSKNERSKQTGNGNASSLFENSEHISPIDNEVTAYNLGVDQYKKLFEFLYANEDDYPEWIYTDVSKGNIWNI